MSSDVCWLSFTQLLRIVSVAGLPGEKVALAIPPPAEPALLPVTWTRSRVTVPSMLAIPPPKSPTDPPVMVRSCADRLPPGPSTSKSRNEFVPSIVAWLPLILIAVVIAGSPFSLSSGLLVSW